MSRPCFPSLARALALFLFLAALCPLAPAHTALAADYTLGGGDGVSGSPGTDGAPAVDDTPGDFAVDGNALIRGGAGSDTPVGTDTSGAGGSAALTVGNNFSTQGMTVIGGNGGDGSNGGLAGRPGGDGGGASLGVNGAFSSLGDVAVTGGNGGVGSGSGNGGAGGGASLGVNGAFSSLGDVAVTGGNGGNGDNTGTGGTGGNALLNVGGAFSSQGDVAITGGNGGNVNVFGTGGAGGDASLRAASVAVAGTLSLTSGLKGTGGLIPSPGGAAELETGLLHAPIITLTRPAANAGPLRFTVGALYARQNTSLTLTNTLAADLAVGSYVFDLTGAPSGATLLSITGNGNINSLDPAMTIGLAGGGRPLPPGYSVTLIKDQSAAPFSGGPAPATLQAQQGAALLHDFDLTQAGDSLTAALRGTTLNPQTESLSEGFLAGLAFTTQGQDVISLQGMNIAAFGPDGLSAFALGEFGSSRYNTNSHINVDGFSLMAGLAWNASPASGRLTLAAFFEGGWGNYDSHNSFSRAAGVDGRGDTEYYGGGILGRYQWNCGGYAEASARMGRVSTDYSSSDLRDMYGTDAEYDTDSLYYGAHAGLGYVWKITDAASLDISTKYLWTRQQGDDVTLSTGDPVTFDDADSHRWRTGGRFSYAVATESGAVFTPYAGAYYEHEFDGKVKASTYGYGINEPDMSGGTGIGEIGLTMKAAGSPLSLDLGARGYLGTREGVTGSLRVRWEF